MKVSSLALVGLGAWLAGCSAPSRPPPDPRQLEVDAGPRSFSIGRAGLALRELTAHLRVDGVEQGWTAENPVTLERDAAGSTRWSGRAGGLELKLTVFPPDGGPSVEAQLEATCGEGCPATGVEVGGLWLSGTVVADPSLPRPAAALVHGYSSWSPTFFATVERTTEPESAFETIGNNQDTTVGDPRTSWWVGLLSHPGAALLTGAITSERWKSRTLTWQGATTRLTLVSGRTGDAVRLKPSQSVASERFVLGVFDTAAGALAAYGEAVAGRSPRRAPPFVPIGWNSWNTLFENVTAQTVADNAGAVKAILSPLQVTTVQIDDGWERSWGDWEANAKFPAGMEATAAALTAQGFRPGLWMAPFFVDSQGAVALAHPEWLLHGTDEARVVRTDPFTSSSQTALDLSHPEARGWVVDRVGEAIARGYRYLKLDFLYAGAFEGRRFDPGQTSLQAYRATLAEILARADAAGAYVMACGAPLLPTAGLAHGVRTGEDIAFRVTAYGFPNIKHSFRNVANRFFVNAFLDSDPDTSLLRGLSEDEKRLDLTATLMSGRLFALGDALDTLSPGDKALLAQVAKFPLPASTALAAGASGFVPSDFPGKPITGRKTLFDFYLAPESYPVPALWTLALGDETTLVAAFNWTEQPLALEVPASGAARELWSQTDLAVEGGKIQLSLPKHSAQLIQLRP